MACTSDTSALLCPCDPASYLLAILHSFGESAEEPSLSAMTQWAGIQEKDVKFVKQLCDEQDLPKL